MKLNKKQLKEWKNGNAIILIGKKWVIVVFDEHSVEDMKDDLPELSGSSYYRSFLKYKIYHYKNEKGT